MAITDIDEVPLLIEVISNFDGFVDIGVFGFDIISIELYLHTRFVPWPLEDGHFSVS
jgi:hypothetical protein